MSNKPKRFALRVVYPDSDENNHYLREPEPRGDFPIYRNKENGIWWTWAEATKIKKDYDDAHKNRDDHRKGRTVELEEVVR